VFGLSKEIGGCEVRAGGAVSDDHDFTWAGDGIDIDFAKDMLLRERYEQVTWSDGLVDFGQPFDAIRQRGHRLGAPDAVDLGDAKLVTRGEDVRVVRAERGGRRDDGNLLHTGRLRRDGGHQDGGRIGGGPAGDADADTFEREVALA
jgi:hypothetical protein